MTNLQYCLRRVLAMVPTLFGITLLTFLLMNLAPGDLVEQKIQMLTMAQTSGSSALSHASLRASGGVSPEVVRAIKRQYGLDRPLLVRYTIWLGSLTHLDFGNSFQYNRPALEVIQERLPVSIQFGLASFILTYLIAVAAGMVMAYHSGRAVDSILSVSFLVLSAVPPFVMAVVLLVLFAGGSFFSWFPIGFLRSENYQELGLVARLTDRVCHFILPLIAYTVGGFASLAFLTRNSILSEVQKDYIRTARAFGASELRLFFYNAFRNALIPVITGIGGFLGVFLGGSLLIENIFQLNGIGRLSYEAILSRDYNLIMALTVLQSLALLMGNLFGDLIYLVVDPRISYE